MYQISAVCRYLSGNVGPVDAGLVKTEPTALAAGAERTVDLRTRPEAPEASAFGSQEMTFSSGQSDAPGSRIANKL